MAIPAIYDRFITDKKKELEGVDKDFGDFVLTLARGGGANEDYFKVMAEMFAPYQQVMSIDEMSEDKARELSYRLLSRTVIRNWKFKENKILSVGLGRDFDTGEVISPSEDNIVELFTAAHELYLEIKRFIENRTNYAAQNRQAAAKNSAPSSPTS